MRLAFVLDRYFPYGGLQRDAAFIALACQQLGHQVEFLTMNWQGNHIDNFPVHEFPQKNLTNNGKHRSFTADIASYQQHHHYDGIIGFNKMPGLDIYYAADLCFAARLEQRKGAAFYRFLPRYRQLLQEEAAVFNPKAKTQVLLISPESLHDFPHYYQTQPERLYLLPPGINRDRCWQTTAPMQRENMRKQLNIAAEQKLLLMLGSGFKTKGVDRSIRALAVLPLELKEQSKLLVVGKDNPHDFIKLAKHLKVSHLVQFILGSDQVPDLLQAADVLIHPAYAENTGTVLLEAVVAGLPVLTTANCGYAFYIDKAQAGCVIPMPFAQEKLNATLVYMLTTREQQQWRQNGIRFGEQEDLYSMPERAAKLITELLQ